MRHYCRRSKRCKSRILTTDPSISRYVPQTVPLTTPNLQRIIVRYATVYVKPDIGSAGRGIYRIERTARGRYLLRGQGRVLAIGGAPAIQRQVNRLAGSRPYLLQQGIRSITRRGLPFDLRVHVQRVQGDWVIGGIVGKLGRRQSVVTNRHRGGQPTEIDHLLTRHLNLAPARRQSLLKEIRRVCLRAARLLERRLSTPREYGFDIGIDDKGFWIYEVNTRPMIVVFSRLGDPRPLRDILLNRKKGNIQR